MRTAFRSLNRTIKTNFYFLVPAVSWTGAARCWLLTVREYAGADPPNTRYGTATAGRPALSPIVELSFFRSSTKKELLRGPATAVTTIRAAHLMPAHFSLAGMQSVFFREFSTLGSPRPISPGWVSALQCPEVKVYGDQLFARRVTGIMAPFLPV